MLESAALFEGFFANLYSHEILQLFVAAALGGVIGFERELAGKDPSLRTFSLICMGSCLFSIMSVHIGTLTEPADPGRIAAQIVSGIGFLGAGAIFRRKEAVAGLTTAAMMWVTAAIGMAVGFGYMGLAISATAIAFAAIYFFLWVHHILRRTPIHPENQPQNGLSKKPKPRVKPTALDD